MEGDKREEGQGARTLRGGGGSVEEAGCREAGDNRKKKTQQCIIFCIRKGVKRREPTKKGLD